MIGSFVCGGLGNQMFQYAAGRSLALRHGTDVLLDLTAFASSRHFDVSRPFELGLLSIETAQPTALSPTRFRLARRLRLERWSGWSTFREADPGHFDPRFGELGDSTYLSGYWQSWRYFADHAARIRRELQPRVALNPASRGLAERMRSTNSVSLHVRRGDYVTSAAANAVHGVLGLEFYEKAVRHLQDRSSDLEAYIFSDDLKWCEAELSHLGIPMTLVDANRDADSWQDLFLMANCRHNIIANSSFSWWAAWLGDGHDHAGRTVIAPAAWLATGSFDLADRYPSNWIVM